MMACGNPLTDPWPRGDWLPKALQEVQLERDALRTELAEAQVEIERLSEERPPVKED